MTIEPGNTAPDTRLPTDGGGDLALKDLRGKAVILYFYPKDDTSGCTAEAQAFEFLRKRFEKAGAAIVGISRDPVKSHDKFKAKYGLGFPLMADVDGKLCQAYGTWVEKSMYGRKYMGIERATFLIDARGKIRNVWRKVKVPGHAEEVLAATENLVGNGPAKPAPKTTKPKTKPKASGASKAKAKSKR